MGAQVELAAQVASVGFRLTEEEDLVVPETGLSPAVAEELFETYGSRIKVTFPTPATNRCYVLRSNGYVGQLTTSDGSTFHIEPKVELQSIFRMLELAYDVPALELMPGTSQLAAAKDIFEHLAFMLSDRILQRVRKGLHREYVEYHERLPVLRGRVDVAESLQLAVRATPTLACDFEDLTSNVDENRIPAWVLYQLRRFEFRREPVLRHVRRAFRALSAACDLKQYASADCARRSYDRMTSDYRPIHAICRFFLDQMGPRHEQESAKFLPFLVNMPRLFEGAVAQCLKQHCSEDYRIVTQRALKLDSGGRYTFRPDIVVEDRRSGQALVVLDTKYKDPEKMALADIAQVIAYATALGCSRAGLVYPVEIAARGVSAGAVDVEPLTWDLETGLRDAGGLSFMITSGGQEVARRWETASP